MHVCYIHDTVDAMGLRTHFRISDSKVKSYLIKSTKILSRNSILLFKLQQSIYKCNTVFISDLLNYERINIFTSASLLYRLRSISVFLILGEEEVF